MNHARLSRLLAALRDLQGVRKVFVASGLRPDLVLADHSAGQRFLEALVRDHVSGQLKIAPEHSEPHVLARMGKPSIESCALFRERFYRATRAAGRDQYLTYYLMAAFPGCSLADMQRLHRFTRSRLQAAPRQIQIFTPTPSTYGALMYHTERDPFDGGALFVEKDRQRKQRQKEAVLPKPPRSARFSKRLSRPPRGAKPALQEAPRTKRPADRKR